MRLITLALVLTIGCAAHTGGDTNDAGSPCEIGTSNGCPTGHYCAEGNVCVAGCATGATCGPGEGCCDHQCVDMLANTSACGSCGNTCDSGASCCDGDCKQMDTLSDCGACGNSCATGDFCDGAHCNQPTYPNFCANKLVYVIYDGITADQHAADVMASTITANCPPDVVVMTGSQTNAALVDQATGQPLAGGGVTYVLGGGPFPNHPLAWLERTHSVTKIYFDAPDGVNYYWRDRTAAPVAMMPGGSCSAHADQFITELVTDPMSGTLSLVGYGACSGGKGTLAAAWYYANVLLPNATNYPDSWYVFSWADTDNNGAPSSGDTFSILAHGL